METDAKVFNNVNYGEVIDRSLVRERRFKRFQPDQLHDVYYNTFGGRSSMAPSIFRLNVGNLYMDSWNTFLTFKVSGVTSSSPEGATLPVGWLRLVDSIVLTDKFGMELERVDKLGEFSDLVARATYGDQYLDSIGRSNRMYGNPDKQLGKLQTATPTDDGSGLGERTVVIPLGFLSGLFRSEQLLPYMLTDGLEIRINWASDLRTVISQRINNVASLLDLSSLNDWPTARVYDAHIVTDLYLLDRDLDRLIVEEYNRKGIPLRFLGYTHAINLVGITAGATNVSHPIKRACSRAIKLLVRIKVTLPVVLATAEGNVSTAMFWPPYETQKWGPGTGFSVKHNGLIVPDIAVSDQAIASVLWYSAFGKTRAFNDGPTTKLAEILENGAGTSFVINLNRDVYGFEQSLSAQYAESTRATSGVRVDGNSPLDLQVALGAITFDQLDMSLYPASVQVEIINGVDMRRELNAWLENERYVILRPTGNSLME